MGRVGRGGANVCGRWESEWGHGAGMRGGQGWGSGGMGVGVGIRTKVRGGGARGVGAGDGDGVGVRRQGAAGGGQGSVGPELECVVRGQEHRVGGGRGELGPGLKNEGVGGVGWGGPPPPPRGPGGSRVVAVRRLQGGSPRAGGLSQRGLPVGPRPPAPVLGKLPGPPELVRGAGRVSPPPPVRGYRGRHGQEPRVSRGPGGSRCWGAGGRRRAGSAAGPRLLLRAEG